MFKRVFLTAVLIMALLVQVSHAACLKPIAKAGNETELFDIYTAQNFYECYSKNELLANSLRGKEVGIKFKISEIKDGLSGWRIIASADPFDLFAKMVFRLKKDTDFALELLANFNVGDDFILVGTVKGKTMGLISFASCWMPYAKLEKGKKVYCEPLKQAYEQGLL